MVRCCLLSDLNNQSMYLLICSQAEVVSVKTILMFGEATANCLQVTSTKKQNSPQWMSIYCGETIQQ